MSDVLEIVFEEVQKKCAIDLVLHLLSLTEKVMDAYSSIGSFEIREGSAITNSLIDLVEFEGGGAVIVTVQGFQLGCLKISSALIRLVKYDRKYDVDFSFDSSATTDTYGLMKKLHREAKLIADKFSATSFFGGLEPANDAETQFFCNDNEGPLMRV